MRKLLSIWNEKVWLRPYLPLVVHRQPRIHRFLRTSTILLPRDANLYGEPEDVEGECNAILYISDDKGDNVATMRCGLEAGHEKPHKERYEKRGMPVTVTWYGCCRNTDSEEMLDEVDD